MSSLLFDAKGYYRLFYPEGRWDTSTALLHMKDFSHTDLRCRIIQAVYNEIFSMSGDRNMEVIKEWIRSGNSLKVVSQTYQCNVNTIKSSIKYYNDHVGSCLYIGNKSLFHILMNTQTLTSDLGKDISNRINEFVVKSRGKRESSITGTSYLNSSNLMISIPRGKMCREISEEEFKWLYKMIYPYSVEIRKRVQQEISQSKTAGYLNYLLIPGQELSDVDRNRREKILGLLPPEDVEKFRAEDAEVRKNRPVSMESKPSEPSGNKETSPKQEATYSMKVHKNHYQF